MISPNYSKGDEIIPSYQYVVIDQKGKEKKGSMEANSIDKVNAALRAEGKIPIKVSEQTFLTKDINFHIGNPIKPRDLAVFCRQFHSIIAAGVTIINALNMLSEQTENKVLKSAIKETQLAIEKGETLSNAMRAQVGIFPNLLINMVEAAEFSGSIETCFDRMAIQFEKSSKLNSILKKAMIYPSVVCLVAIGVIVIMLTVVIPNFMSIFDDLDMEMPAITVAVIQSSKFMVNYWYLLLVILVAIVILFRIYKHSESGRKTLSKISLKLPIFGKIIIKSASGSFGRTISTLLSAGIALPTALEITSRGMNNVIIREVLVGAKKEVERGIPLSAPLEASGVFPPMVYQMAKIGEETGNVETMLTKLAEYYEEDVETATQSMVAALEPLIIIVLALVVGVILMAIFQPMMSLYSGMDNLSK